MHQPAHSIAIARDLSHEGQVNRRCGVRRHNHPVFKHAVRQLPTGNWVKFRHVILPLSRNATFTVILLSFIGGLRSFDLIWTMTRGGPGFASDVLTSVIYKQYQAGFYGLSTAGNVVLFILVTIIVYPLMRFFNRKELEL